MKRVLCYSVLFSLAVFAAVAWGDYDIGYYLMENYGVDAYCNNHNVYMNANLLDFNTYMANKGTGWDSTFRVNNVYDYHLVDSSKQTWGESDNYTESHDIAIVLGHGGITSNKYYLQANRSVQGRDYCRIFPHADMYLGESDVDIEWLIVHSCHSMDDEDYTWRDSWRPAFHGIHQVFGFHGVTWASSTQAGTTWIRENYEAFAQDAYVDGIADSWVFNMYETDIGPDDVDQCPVAYTGRATLANCDSILNYEKFPTPGQVNIVYQDVYSPTYWRRRFHGGCDPQGGGAM